MAGHALFTCVLAAALVGCAAEQAPLSPPPLTAEVKQYRRDIAPRILSVAVTNPGDRAVVVRRLDLLAGGYEDEPPAEVEVEVPPGRRVDVRVPYGAARCDVRPSGSDAALLDVQDVDGQGHQVRLELPPGNGLLDRLHSRECADRALRAAVDVRLSQQWSRVGDQLRGALVLERRSGSAPVTVVEPGGNVLFTVRPVTPGSPLGTLDAAAAGLEIPLEVTATRCDGHALAESKRSYVLTFYVAPGGGPPQLVSTTADEALQRQLDRLALDTCRPGG